VEKNTVVVQTVFSLDEAVKRIGYITLDVHKTRAKHAVGEKKLKR